MAPDLNKIKIPSCIKTIAIVVFFCISFINGKCKQAVHSEKEIKIESQAKLFHGELMNNPPVNMPVPRCNDFRPGNGNTGSGNKLVWNSIDPKLRSLNLIIIFLRAGGLKTFIPAMRHHLYFCVFRI